MAGVSARSQSLKLTTLIPSKHFSRIENCTMFGTYKIDGYVCQPLDPAQPSPSQVLSDYLNKDVHLIMKGPGVRTCEPTPTFPDLKADHVFQARVAGLQLILSCTDTQGRTGIRSLLPVKRAYSPLAPLSEMLPLANQRSWARSVVWIKTDGRTAISR